MKQFSLEEIGRRIFVLRGQRVMLDIDLAEIYGMQTKALNQQVKRNAKRFPQHFMFQLTAPEAAALRSHFATSNVGRGGRRYRPFAFTKHGAVMLAGVLNTPRAVYASVRIVEAFVSMTHLLSRDEELAKRVARLESRAGKHDQDIKFVLMTLRELMVEPGKPPRKIGFGS